MMMIKSRGGSGTLRNAQFLNFTGHTNAYTLNLNAFWSSQSQAAGNGVQYRNLTFQHWRGTCSNGQQRAPVQILCPAQVPCTDIKVDDFNIWTEAGNVVQHKCENAFGEGVCLGSGAAKGAYSKTTNAPTLPTAAYAIQRMPGEIPGPRGLGITKSIDIPAIPTSFYPGLKPTSARMADMA
jgi:rhamnogalacturonan hydrolase